MSDSSLYICYNEEEKIEIIIGSTLEIAEILDENSIIGKIFNKGRENYRNIKIFEFKQYNKEELYDVIDKLNPDVSFPYDPKSVNTVYFKGLDRYVNSILNQIKSDFNFEKETIIKDQFKKQYF